MLKASGLPIFLDIPVYANDTSPYVPEFWAMESIAILQENMVAANLIHRDFEPTLAQHGDIVNTRKPSEFTAKRKTNDDNVTVQDAISTNIQVKLDQHVHTSFMIKDGEQSKALKDLIDEYMMPAMLAQARFIDQIILGQYPQFLKYTGGQLLKLTTSNGKTNILDTRNQLNVNKAQMPQRNLILTPNTETNLLNLDLFTQAQQVGDEGTALREASLGRKLGFDMYMCQNMSTVLQLYTPTVGAINFSAGYAKGKTGSLVVDGFTGALATGSWLDLDGIPYRIVSHTEGSGNTTGIVLDRALNRAVANDAVVSVYIQGAVNQSVSPTGYAAGYAKEITIDGFTAPASPQVGQMVTFGATSVDTTPVYTIIGVNGVVGITLDRPLEAAIADNAVVNLGPPGEFNLSFLRNAMTLVVRPLALPPEGTGARSAVVNDRGLSIRATLTYDGKAQGTLVTLDMLCGIKVLEPLLGAVMLG